MTPDDILIAIGILEGAILGWLVAGMLIRSTRRRAGDMTRQDGF